MSIIFQVDKIFASILPIGRYPLLSVSRITVIVRLSWLVSLVISISVNAVYPCSYEPAAVLCIPLLPSGFFYTLLSFLCLIFVCLIIGFTATIFFLKKVRQRRSHRIQIIKVEAKLYLARKSRKAGIYCPWFNSDIMKWFYFFFRNSARSRTLATLWPGLTIKLWRRMQ